MSVVFHVENLHVLTKKFKNSKNILSIEFHDDDTSTELLLWYFQGGKYCCVLLFYILTVLASHSVQSVTSGTRLSRPFIRIMHIELFPAQHFPCWMGPKLQQK